MKNINKVHEGNITVDEDIAVTGILIGSADVYEGRTLHVGGIMSGNIKVRSGAKLSVSGILNGDIIDDGGDIVISGMHNGKRV